jgi:hypothetical protein
VSATAGNASATVSWTAPANGGSTITGYTVTASPGGATATVSGSTLTATLTGLTNGQAYTFTVTATNAVGTSAPSSPSNSVTPVALASYAVIQQKQALLGSGASSTTVTLATPATAGDLLVATGAVYPGTAAGVTGPSGFTLAGSTTGAGSSGEYLWYKVAAGGETSFTFNQASSSSNYSEFGVTETSGGFSSVSVDGAPAWQSSASKVTGFTQTYGSAPSSSGELAYSFFVTSNATAQTTPSGWTLIGSPTATNDNSGSYLEQAGTTAPTITTSGLSPSGGYTAGMVVFKFT